MYSSTQHYTANIFRSYFHNLFTASQNRFKQKSPFPSKRNSTFKVDAKG